MNQAISLTSFRKNIFRTFELLRDTKIAVPVAHRRKIYMLYVEPTNQRVTEPYKRGKRTVKKIDPELIETTICSICEDLLVNGICMNGECKTNKKAI